MNQTLIRIAVVFATVAALAFGVRWLRTDESGDRQGESTGQNSSGNTGADFAELPALDESIQKYIWDLEHYTFVIEQRLFPKLAAALGTSSRPELDPFVTDAFFATVPAQPSEVVERGSIRFARWTPSGSSETRVDAQQFCEYFAARLQEFERIDKVGLRVLNIAAEDRDPDSGRWELRVLVSATGESTDGRRLSFAQTSLVDCRFLDAEEIVAGRNIASWRVETEMMTASPPLMVEATDRFGLDRIPLHDNWDLGGTNVRQYFMQIACDDFTLDGRPDIAIATLTGHAFLLAASDGERMIDVTNRFGVPNSFPVDRKQAVAALFDFDNDGDPDLLLGSRLYRNVAGRRFEPVANTGLRFGYNPMGAVVADYDCDGRLDLYVVYQSSPETGASARPGWVGDDHSGAPNQLWRNVGDGRFEDVTDSVGVGGERRHSFAATWLHANDDHFPDLYVANDFAQNEFYLNRGDGTFQDASAPSRTADFATSMGVAAGDVDGDGRSEIYVANMYSKMGRRIIAQVSEADYPPGVYDQLKGSCAGNRLYTPEADGKSYTEVSDRMGVNAVGWAYAPALADFDSDGLLDIYATAGFLSFRRDKPDG